MARQIVVDIVGDSSKFNKATDDATTHATGLKGKLGDFGKGIAVGAGVGAFNLLTGSIDTAVSKLFEAQAAYKEDQASQSLLATAIKNSGATWDGDTSKIEANISAWQAKGVSDSLQREGISAFVNQTKDLTTAQDLNTAAIELAAATGKTYEEAQGEISSAIEGKAKALEKDGVAVAKGATAMDIATAVTDRYKGSQDALAETSAGKTAISQEKVGEAMEKIGGIVDGVVQNVLPIAADAFVAVTDAISTIADAVGPVVQALATQLGPVMKTVGEVARSVFGTVRQVVEALAPVFRVIFGAIGAVVGVFVNTVKAYFSNVATAIGILMNVFRTISGIVGGVMGGVATVIGAGVGVIKGIFNTLATAVGILGNVFRTLGSIVQGAWNGVTGIIRGSVNFIIDLVNHIIDGINSIQVHIEVGPVKYDFNGLNIGHLPRLHQGGVVPGVPGSDVMTLLQAGETVTAAGAPGGAVHLNIGTFIGSGPDIDRFVDLIAERMRLAG